MVRKIAIQIFSVSLVCLLYSCGNDRALVVGKIQSASKLSTTEITIDKLVFGTKSKRILWAVKLKDANFLAKSKAIVKSGIDLSKIQKDDIVIDGKSITLNLPGVEVINFSYPPDYFEKMNILSEKQIGNNITLEDQERFFQEAEIDIRNSLAYTGIREITEDKTTALLKPMLSNLGYNEVYISYKDSKLLKTIE